MQKQLTIALLFATPLFVSHAYAAALPRFEDYAVTPEIVAQHAKPRIVTRFDKMYRTRLRFGAQGEPNFAGHYVFTFWGCGAACLMGGAIDVKSGNIVDLPFSISNFPMDVDEPVQFKLTSRLLILYGSRNEHGDGVYYYELTGNRFKLLRALKPQG